MPVFAGDTFSLKSISVKQQIILLPSSWEAFPKTFPNQLKSVSFFEGHPKNRVALVNDNSEIVDDKKRNSHVVRFIKHREHGLLRSVSGDYYAS